MQFGVESRLWRAALVFGQDLVARAALAPSPRSPPDRGRAGSDIPRSPRLPRQDVHGRAAGNHVGLHGGMGRIETRIGIGAQPVPHIVQQVTNSPAIITALAPFSGALE